MEQVEMTQNPEADGRTFTQEELEEIVQKRLARDRRSRSGMDGLQAREKELENRELFLEAKEQLMEAGLPAGLAEVLRYEDREALEKAVRMIQDLGAAQPAGWGQRPSGGRASAYEDPIKRAMGLEQ